MAQKYVWYNGAKYELIGHGFAEAQTGDLFESIGNLDETKGRLYEITVDGSDIMRFADDKLYWNGYFRKSGTRNLYRKVQDEDEAVTDRYVGIKREDVQGGDFIEYRRDDHEMTDVTIGKYYEVIGLDHKGRPYYIDDVEDEVPTWDYEDWVAWRKVGAGTECEQVEPVSKPLALTNEDLERLADLVTERIIARMAGKQ